MKKPRTEITNESAKFVLNAYRPNGADAQDPVFRVALEQAKTQIFLAMSAQYSELLNNSSAEFWLSVPPGKELPERTDELIISMLRFCTLVSMTYLLFLERRVPKRMWELMLRSAERRFHSPLFVREWEHLRTEFESFPEFVALVASVHHMPPHTENLGPGPVLPAQKEGHRSPC